MFGSEVLDVAIGLVLLFLILSLICSSIREAIETAVKSRARDLERGIREMFGDLKRQNLVPQFYNHPLINGLFKDQYDPSKPTNLPSYIPSGTFALTLIDLVMSGKAQRALEGAANVAEAIPPSFTDLRQAVTNLPPDSNLRGALLPLIDAAGNDAIRVRQNVENWFNASMDRVSGWYKRRTQIILAAVGFSIAGFLNVDAIAIARYLNTNQTARSVLVAQVEAHRRALAQAAEAGGAGAQPAPQAPGQSSDLSDPLGWLERQGGLPLGWRFSPEPGQPQTDFERDWRRAPVSPGGWLLKITGILFTGFAVTLGAPFWFDVLNKIMVIRSTVKPEEKSHEEPSKE
ncbi:MAG: hypothetical protein JOZ48_23530 [Acidobacteriaceae bacterium]|nr:hypothetical protein [Acidobacteriaceae bacterium]